MTSLGAVLEQFPDEVIVYITDPRTGIQRRSKWPPTINEIIEAGEQHQEHLARFRAPRREPLPRLPALLLKDRPAGAMAQVFVPEGHPRYDGLTEWAKTADSIWWKYGRSSDNRAGIWVSHGAWDEPHKHKR